MNSCDMQITPPKKTKTEKDYYLINSTYRNYPDESTEFTYVFPEPIKDVTELTLYNVQIPIDQYLSVSEHNGNNVFYIDGSGGTITVTIPTGNYDSVTDHVNIINLTLKQIYTDFIIDLSNNEDYTRVNGVVLHPLGNHQVDEYMNSAESNMNSFFATLDSSCGIFAYNSDGNNPYQISLCNFTGNPVTIRFSNTEFDPNFSLTYGYILGYRLFSYTLESVDFTEIGDWDGYKIEGLYYTADYFSSDPGEPYVLQGEVSTTLVPIRSFILAVEDYVTNHSSTVKVCYNGSYLSRNVLGWIPINGNGWKGGLFNKLGDNEANRRRYGVPTDIRKLRIALLDDKGRRISLLGMDWSLMLGFAREIPLSKNI